MRLAPVHRGDPACRGSECRPGPVGDRAQLLVVACLVRRGTVGVKGDHRIRLDRREDAFLEHQLRAAFLAGRYAFLGGLEDEHHRARQAVAHRGEYRGRAEQRRGVHVVAAGMRDADIVAEVGAARRGLEREIRDLGDRQRIDVRAHGDRAAWQAAFEDADDAGVRDAGSRLDPELLQVRRDERAGARLAVREFRVLVDVLAVRDRGGGIFRDQVRDFGVGRPRGGSGGRGEQAGGGHDGQSSKVHEVPLERLILRTTVPRCHGTP